MQNATATLLQNAAKVYHKMRQVFYYKTRPLLQIATFAPCVGTIYNQHKFGRHI